MRNAQIFLANVIILTIGFTFLSIAQENDKFMDQNIVGALNDLIAREAQGVANYRVAIQIFQSNNLNGYAIWLSKRKDKKDLRIQKIINYLASREIPRIQSIPSNPTYGNPLEAFKSILSYDFNTTDKARWTINEAEHLNDIEAADFVRSLVDEQVEEEATASELLEKTRKEYNHRHPNRFGLGLIDYSLK